MDMIWVSTGSSREAALAPLLIGLLLLVFSPFIPAFIGIFIAAILFVFSLLIAGISFSVKGTAFFAPALLLGIIGACMSLFALFNPDITVSLMGILLGVIVLMMGIVQIGFSPGFSHDTVSFLFLIIGGLLSVVVGVYLMLSPQEGMQLLVVFIGCYLIVYGLIGVIRGRSQIPCRYEQWNER